MAQSRRKTRKPTGSRKQKGARAARTNGASRSDAISLLEADHREVEGWFEEFEKTNSDSKKQDLAQRICTALTVHATIEEEIFYPAFLEATDERDLHHEAAIEHDGAKKLIAEIEGSSPEDDYFDARVSVLSEMIKHHVKEEEQRGGMFAKARQSEMDLEQLGDQLRQRKDELMAEHGSRTSMDELSRGGSRRRAAMMGRNSKGRHEGIARRG